MGDDWWLLRSFRVFAFLIFVRLCARATHPHPTWKSANYYLFLWNKYGVEWWQLTMEIIIYIVINCVVFVIDMRDLLRRSTAAATATNYNISFCAIIIVCAAAWFVLNVRWHAIDGVIDEIAICYFFAHAVVHCIAIVFGHNLVNLSWIESDADSQWVINDIF